jgi:hypothetical protein
MSYRDGLSDADDELADKPARQLMPVRGCGLVE